MGKHRKCTYCGEDIVLRPSAAARARADVTGSTNAKYYLDLFTSHTNCMLDARAKSASEAMAAARERAVEWHNSLPKVGN